MKIKHFSNFTNFYVIETYDPKTQALHLHLSVNPDDSSQVKVDVSEFPLFPIDPQTGIASASREMFHRLLTLHLGVDPQLQEFVNA